MTASSKSRHLISVSHVHNSKPTHAVPDTRFDGAAFEPPPNTQLGEAELEGLFSDLFTSPPSTSDPSPLRLDPKSTPKDSMAVINALQKRFKIHQPLSSEQDSISEHPLPPELVSEIKGKPSYLEVLEKMEGDIVAAEGAQPSTSTKPPTSTAIPLGLATQQEWESLFHATIDAGDRHNARRVVDLMKRSGVPVEPNLEDRLLFSFVFAKDVEGVNAYMEEVRSRGEVPTEVQRHLHVEALIVSRRFDEAQKLLHHYESEGLVPSQSTYRNFIGALFDASKPSSSPHSPQYRALAWDMFAHMRYVAHPTPSLDTYNTMLRACADAISPSPQRALDLFHEMTVENRIRPTTATYNAVMLTCSRSGRRDYMHEAYRLGKQLLDEYRHLPDDRSGAKEQLQPDLETFKAMLEAAKRMGDLPRARWILAELVRLGERVDEELMGHVFHVYASFKPTFQRSAVPIATQDDLKEIPNKTDTDTGNPDPEARTPSIQLEPHAPIIPQSREEVLQEAQALFRRILRGQEVARMGDMWTDTSHPDWPFSSVKITTNLLNAYLSVHLNHVTPEKALSLFISEKESLYKRFGATKNSQSFAMALERLAVAKGRDGRKEAIKLAEEVWREWIAFSTGRENSAGIGLANPLSPRRIESIWATMIRIVSCAGDTDRAVQLVKAFVERYPPRSVLPTPTPSATSATTSAAAVVKPLSPSSLPQLSLPARVSLVAAQPLVRLTVNSKIPDTGISPFLCFKDLEILHHRLVSQSETGSPHERRMKKEALRFLTWACKAYEGHLKRRKDWATKRR
ncbi:hypothetical protein M407DRAFT_27028 [Tulasnella calospora MUT 4182]|uniref:Pentacotripeptide-repeat region of PRORP domain-containing protein n=1 Tax=Tulasnella calospora MUT 4182 TaxID=1051891 RepID=A0A0C3LQ08_9AGAM|nr:hypothetical protein M407DRAFT_27028 [Tulasnella calospora MUT 4182]